MKTLAFFILCASLFGAIGDQAGEIPPSYIASHPRLGAPSNAQLIALWNGGSLPTRFSDAANNWDTACITASCNPTSFRYMLMAYLASKAGGAPNAAWQAKLFAMADLGPEWGQVEFSDNTASASSSGCTGTCTLTDANVNFLTGCAGGSCAGYYLVYLGLRYTIPSVTDATHVVIQPFGADLPYPFPNGTNLPIRVLNTMPPIGDTGFLYAILYDWDYPELASRSANMQASMENLCLQMENDYVNANYSPYNDEFYANGSNSWNGGPGDLAAALALYPDVPTSIPHLRWAMDVFLVRMLPVWQQVMSDGGWPESWNDYQNSTQGPYGQHAYIVTIPLMWANATGQMPGYFTSQYPWLKNYGYQLMYTFKPDFVPLNYGASQPQPTAESDINLSGAGIGALNGLGEIYNDPVLRGWARLVNDGGNPDGFEPSAWPYYTPDNNSNSTASRAGLPLCRNFTGWGQIVCRSGWTENDTWMSFKYGDSFWGHQHMDAGQFDIFNRGTLAIDSGTYHAGSFSKHVSFYATQAIAHNTITVTDSADTYPSQLVEVISHTGTDDCETMPNDGGQRRVGSGWQVYYSNSACTGGVATNVAMNSPPDLAAWRRGAEYFHTGTLQAFVPSPNIAAPKWVYMAADLTAAYNNPFSGNSLIAGYGMSNRTERVAKFIRHIVFIPRGLAGYVVVFDQVTSTNAAFPKKWLLHSINAPAITGNKFVIQRTENAAAKPYPGTWPNSWMLSSLANVNSTCGTTNGCYQYGGQLTGYSVAVNGANTLATVGGPGHEFDDGTGTNQNDCQFSIECADATDLWGFGNTGSGCTAGTICPTSAAGPFEPGAYRIEETPASAATQDWFANVMLAQSATDTNIVSTAPTSSVSGSDFVITWKDNSDTCTYTVTLHKSGIGGAITATGAGCANVI